MKIFRIEVHSAFPEWERYAVYMTAVCFDAAGEMTDYVSTADGGVLLETPPCDHADLYLYVIAREFPAAELISASPPFDVEVVVNGVSTAYPVNQWGGLSVKQLLI